MGVLAVIALLGFGVFKAEPSLAVGDPAPDAELPLLSGEGTTSLAELRGSWVLVNIWASWCPPCEEESPEIQAFLEDHADEDFVVYGVDSRDSSDAGRAFAAEYGLTWEMVRDGDGSYADAWAATGQPESFLVNPEGRVALICRRPVSRENLDDLVAPYLQGETPTTELSLCETG